MKKRHQQKLILLAAVLFFLWNVPFVALFDKKLHVLGFPLFYAFIFLCWLGGIIISYIILKKFYE